VGPNAISALFRFAQFKNNSQRINEFGNSTIQIRTIALKYGQYPALLENRSEPRLYLNSADIQATLRAPSRSLERRPTITSASTSANTGTLPNVPRLRQSANEAPGLGERAAGDNACAKRDEPNAKR
jgi:hypothetical protein